MTEFNVKAYSGIVGGAGMLVSGVCRPSFVVTLNNLDAIAECIANLRDELEGAAASVFSDNDARKVAQALETFAAAAMPFKELIEVCVAFSSGLTSCVKSSMSVISGPLLQRVRPLLDRFAAVSYEMTEGDFADCDANDPFALAALAVVDSQLETFDDFLTHGCKVNLVTQIADGIAKRVEELVFAKRFTLVIACLCVCTLHGAHAVVCVGAVWWAAAGPRCARFVKRHCETLIAAVA